MTDRVIAISSQVNQCGKRVSDSKKKFIWRFRIGDTTYDLQLVSSALSGKRAIYLNDKLIYQQQNVLNIKFDFTHSMEGHSLRIFRQSQSVHSYDLRIDNRAFDYLLKKKDNPVSEPRVTGKYQASNDDPFSQFQKMASSNNNQAVSSNDGFGDFQDFSNNQWTKQEKSGSQTQKKVEQNKFSEFDFNEKKSGLNAQNFETNNLSNLQKNLASFDLLNTDNFTTNNYGNYNNYLDLIDGKQKSDTFGQPVDPNSKTILDKIKPDMTGKQMFNKTLMTAVQMKKKAVNHLESLI